MAFGCYHFEAKHLQDFVFRTGKLREATGASELINHICGLEDGKLVGLAGEIARKAVLSCDPERAVGGVLTICTDDAGLAALLNFRALFRLALAKRAPGLSYADGLCQSAEDKRTAMDGAHGDMVRSGPLAHPDVPAASPLVRPAARSGLAPHLRRGWTDKTGRCVITGEFADLETLAKRQFLAQGNDALACKFSGTEPGEYIWPVVFAGDKDENADSGAVFPFHGEDRSIALVHIDGNGIGQTFVEAAAQGKDTKALSEQLAGATITAANAAMRPVLEQADASRVVPARPVLLGGDDLTLIIRADLAFGFVRAYLTAFEHETAQTALGRKTAKAGLVFMGARQPFAQAYELCEDLAHEAKNMEESRLCFWRLTDTLIPRSVDELCDQTAGHGGGVHQWRGAFSLAEFRKLECLANVLKMEAVGRGPLRQVPELLKSDPNRAKALYRRALDVLKKRDICAHEALVNAMSEFGIAEREIVNEAGYCPLLDAHHLFQIRKAGTG